MMPNDVEIWERFIDKYPDAYISVVYDFALGGVPEHATEPVLDGGNNMGRLYQRKIDVLATNGQQLDLIELKPNAGTSTVGQVLGYKHLFERDVEQTYTLTPMIVTNAMDADAQEFAAANGVKVVLV